MPALIRTGVQRGTGPRATARRGTELVGAGRRGPGHRARTLHRPPLRWRVLVATTGAVILTVCSGMALGVVTWTPSGPDLRFRSAPQSPPVVTGSNGVWPGGPAHNVPLTVQNTDVTTFEISGVSADLGALPASCPAGAWQVAVPELLPTVPARSEVIVPLPVSLRHDAPETCQGVTVRFPVRVDGLRSSRPMIGSVAATAVPSGTGPVDRSGDPAPGAGQAGSASEPGATALLPEHLTTTATVTAAILGSPGGTVTVRGPDVEIVPSPPASGPAPARYDVTRLGAGSTRTTVCASTTGPCLDRGAPAAAEHRYLVTAGVGSRWHRSGQPLTAWTPPPAPGLTFADGSRGSASTLVVSAHPGASAYDVELLADGTPFHRVRIAAGGSLSQIVQAPRLAPGRHRLVAVALFRDWRATSGTLEFTTSEAEVAEPGPSEVALPVTSQTDLAPPIVGPPVVTLPTGPTAAVPSRRSSPPAVATRRVANPASGPPQPTIEDLMPTAEEPTAAPVNADVVAPPVAEVPVP